MTSVDVLIGWASTLVTGAFWHSSSVLFFHHAQRFVEVLFLMSGAQLR